MTVDLIHSSRRPSIGPLTKTMAAPMKRTITSALAKSLVRPIASTSTTQRSYATEQVQTVANSVNAPPSQRTMQATTLQEVNKQGDTAFAREARTRHFTSASLLSSLARSESDGDSQLWSSASCGSRCTAPHPRTRRRGNLEGRSAHRSAAQRDGEGASIISLSNVG